MDNQNRVFLGPASGFAALVGLAVCLGAAPAWAAGQPSPSVLAAADAETGAVPAGEVELPGESVGVTSEDAEVDGEPAAGERPAPPPDEPEDFGDSGDGLEGQSNSAD